MQPSIASGKRPCVGHHIKNGGASRKADAKWIVPLTAAEHHELHEHGAATFEKKYGLSLDFMAQQTELRWAAFSRGDEQRENQT